MYLPTQNFKHDGSRRNLHSGSIAHANTLTQPQLDSVVQPPQSPSPQPSQIASLQGSLSEHEISDHESDNPDHIDFSGEVRERIKKPQRKSTRSQYDARVKIFKEWCRDNRVSTSRPPHNKVADFFQYLFDEKGHQPRSIVGFRTAISDFYSKTRLDLHTQVFRNLMRSYFRDRPPALRTAPPWDLAVILDCLKRAPFEPMPVAQLKFVTLKTVFLITLATGRRRSEIHAIWFQGISSSMIDGNLVYTLPVLADFIAKNQLNTQGFDVTKVILVPSLQQVLGPDLWDSEDRYLCPVRALQIYLERTAPVRHGRKRLIIPYSPGIKREIASSTVSGYIVQTMKHIYSQEGLLESLLARGISVKAHQVRSCSASWAFLKGKVALEQLMNSCFWRSQTTFTSHYLRHYWTNHSNDHYTLTPFVAAGAIIDPASP